MQELTAQERAVGLRAAQARATVPDLELSVVVSGGFSTGELLRACASALAEHPRANGAYRDGRLELYSRINLGLVVAAGETYLIPTVFDAERKSVEELEREARELARAAISEELASPALRGATFTVWNAAEQGLDAAAIPPVPPQAAALVAGLRALTLCCDHRILYGAPAASFLKALADHLDRNRV